MLDITEKDVGRYVKLEDGTLGILTYYFHPKRSAVRVFDNGGDSELIEISHVAEFLESSDPTVTLTELNFIVGEFNKQFKSWQNRTQCRASFLWNYAGEKGLSINAVESLDISAIDKIIYRKELVSDDSVAEALKGSKSIGEILDKMK